MAKEVESMSGQARVVGEVPEILIEGDQEGVSRRGFEGIGGGGSESRGEE